MEEQISTNIENKSIEPIITGIKFKLNLSSEQRQEFNKYFDEYSKAINFCAKLVYRERKLIKFVGRKEQDSKKWKYDVNICDYCNSEKEINYQNQGNAKKICKDCYKKDFSDNALRKKMIPVRGKKVSSAFNIHNATKKLSDTHRHWAFGDAVNILKSLERQRKEKRKKLLKSIKKLQYFKELYEKPEIRHELPLIGKQRMLRYLHKNYDKNALDKKRGYTLSNIKGKIKIMTRNIERDQKSLRKVRPISFKGSRIQLSESDPKKTFKIDENLVRLALNKKLTGWYNFYGTNIKNEQGKKYINENLKKILDGGPKYSYLLRKRISDNDDFDYYLQYTIDTKTPLKTEYAGIIGLDAGTTNLATIVSLKKQVDPILCKYCKLNHTKPNFVRFFSGAELKALRIASRKQRFFLRGKHNKLAKIKRIRPIEPKVDEYCHKISKQIVEIAKQNNFAIAVERLEKPKKSKFKQRRRTKYALSLFIFKKLATFIGYKAARDGIRVIPVDPEGTSYTCSHCKNAQNNQRPYRKSNTKKSWTSMFKCGKCNIELNSDYNAAFNIAQKGLNILNAS